MITRENYEAFYLDFLEGTLSKETEKAFLAFLAANPDLQVDEDLPFLNEDESSLTEFDKLLLKKDDETSTPLGSLSPTVIINKKNIEYYLVAQLENQLSNTEKSALEQWLNQHPEYLKDKALYAKTVLPQENIAYLNKGELYQEARIIPLWARVSAAAASVILLLGLAASLNYNSVEVNGPKLPQLGSIKGNPTKVDSLHQPIQQYADKHNYGHHTNQKNDQVTPIQNQNPEQNMASNDQKLEEPKKDNPLTNGNGGILPDQPDLATHVTENHHSIAHEGQNDYAFGANPIEPITNELSKRLNTVIDFRRAKEEQDKPSGFYVKIGRFEFLHKKGGKH